MHRFQTKLQVAPGKNAYQHTARNNLRCTEIKSVGACVMPTKCKAWRMGFFVTSFNAWFKSAALGYPERRVLKNGELR